jgi:hypothetical protein
MIEKRISTMNLKNLVSRRNFITSAAVGIGGIVSARFLPVFGKDIPGAWVDKKQINPLIDNCRVVCCIDPAMVTADPRKWDFPSQNTPVVAEKVRKNLDAMACSLAQKELPPDAWAAIFRKPSSKSWADVKVAIKPNAFGRNNPRVAIIDAVCRALIGLGVQSANITIYDGEDASALYAAYVGNGLPARVIVSRKHDQMGGKIPTEVPRPHQGRFKCSAALADGTIDILVNIAVNKGHSLGGITMTMKNHAGTFEAMPIHLGGGLKYIIAFNKSEAILGGTPVRQQLCIVDSIWAMTKGPFGIPDKRPCALVMGTFSPAVDYIVARRIREPLMGCKHPDTLKSIMTGFGYADFEDLDFIKVRPA